MEKNKRWPVLGPVTFLLVVIMLFADFFGRDIVPFDQWMQQSSRSQVDEEKPPQSPFARLVRGNIFHEFNDILIPLFITTKHFQSRVLILLEDYDPSFAAKYSKIFSQMSSYEVMNPAANRSMHCFPGMILGLKYHDNLALNPSDIPGGYSIHDFRQLIGET
ncbi:UNVERIFIED_CONTAM: Xylan glycosyltransferase MUCI21 [Sesamum radiatum]|uniref:Xylan glycosyltransferase MUCI21 n=1 Tax=Sesamum radiatum TaxID=300843 RepID=A0AAW2KJH7_SESRA